MWFKEQWPAAGEFPAPEFCRHRMPGQTMSVCRSVQHQ